MTGFSSDVQLFFLDVGYTAAANIEAFRTTLLESVGDVGLTLVA